MGNAPKVVLKADEKLEENAVGFMKNDPERHIGGALCHPTKMMLAIPGKQSINFYSLPNLESIGSTSFETGINQCTYGPDGILAVTSSKRVYLFDGTEKIGEFEVNWNAVEEVDAGAAVASGKHQRVVVQDFEGKIMLVDFQGKEIWSVDARDELNFGWNDPGIPFLIDNDRIVSTLGERFLIWDEGEVDLPYRGDATGKTPEPQAMLVHPDGTEVVEVQYEKPHSVYDAETLELKHKIEGAAATTGRYLADGRIALWNNLQITIVDGDDRKEYPSMWNGLWNFGVAPDGKHVWFRSHLNDWCCMPIDAEPKSSNLMIDGATISLDGKFLALSQRKDYNEPMTVTIREIDGDRGASYTMESNYAPGVFAFTPNNDLIFASQWGDEGKENTFKLSLDGTVKKVIAGNPFYEAGADVMLNLPKGDAWDDDDKLAPAEIWNLDFEKIDTFEIEGASSYEDSPSTRFVSFTNSDWDTLIYDREKKVALQHPVEQVSGTYAIWDDWDKDSTMWYDLAENKRITGNTGRFYNFVISAKHDKVFFIDDDEKGQVWKANTASERMAFVDTSTLPPEEQDEDHGKDYGQLYISTDQDYVIHADYDSNVHVFRAEDNQRLFGFKTPFDASHVLCTQGKLVLVHTYGLVEVYDLAT